MGFLEKRRSPRVDIDTFISYYLLDENDKIFKGGFGETKNTSDVGLLIVTSEIIETEYILVAITDGRKNIIEMKEKVIQSRKDKNGNIYTGIELIGDDDKKSEFARHLKKAHRMFQDASSLSVGF